MRCKVTLLPFDIAVPLLKPESRYPLGVWPAWYGMNGDEAGLRQKKKIGAIIETV